MNTARPILSLVRLRRYRLQAGLSERALARATAMTGMSITALEEGRNHDELTLRHLVRISRTLNVDPAALFPTDADHEAAAAAPDDRKIESALASLGCYTRTHELARGLGWTLDRTVAALEQLANRLQPTGQRLATQNGRVKLMPAAGVLTDNEERNVQNASRHQRGLTLSLAQILRNAVDGKARTGRQRRTNANQLLAEGSLLNLGLADIHAGRLEPSEDVLYGLALDARPKRPE
jgi:transcriptional regulator with XRE-family HTH domain